MKLKKGKLNENNKTKNMEINELRIGNFVKHKNEIKKVIGIISTEEGHEIWMIDKKKQYWKTNKADGYEISDEILLKLGLSKIKLINNEIGYGKPYNKEGRLELFVKSDGEIFYKMLGQIKFIHELQNEIFVFDKNELFKNEW